MSLTLDSKLRTHAKPLVTLMTGINGFIGSNLLEILLKLNQRVIELDNFSVQSYEVQGLVNPVYWDNFCFIEGDMKKQGECADASTVSNMLSIRRPLVP